MPSAHAGTLKAGNASMIPGRVPASHRGGKRRQKTVNPRKEFINT
jgi:hypothetical protein